MMSKVFTALAAVAAAASFTTAAHAVVITFSGNDDGVAIGGAYTNSLAAQAAFLSAAGAKGTIATETFESSALGYHSTLAIDGGSLSVVAPDLGTGLSGVSNVTYGNTFGFNTTTGGSQWFGFPSFLPSGVATFTFDGPSKAFGFFSTGVQTDFTASIVVSLLDGSQSVFNLPLNTSGGVSYFGLVDTVGFTSVSILNTSQPGQSDAWGIDDVSFHSSLVSEVPEPASWAMLIAGFGLVGATQRRRRAIAANA